MDQRTLDLQQIANDVERITNNSGRVTERISITFEKLTPFTLRTDFTDWQRDKFHLVSGDEYFFISQGPALLYVVNVTADAILMATAELMKKVADKF